MNNNRNEIAENVERYIEEAEAFKARFGTGKKFMITYVYDDLSIFDWWNDYLSLSQLKQMQKFLETAEKLGYNGYVCFKVGAKHCSNGMWAYKRESTEGHSPDGECLYHSFVNGRNDWDAKLANGMWAHDVTGKFDNSLKEIQSMI